MRAGKAHTVPNSMKREGPHAKQKTEKKKNPWGDLISQAVLAFDLDFVILLVALFPLSSSLIYLSTKPTPCRPLTYGRAKRAIAPWQGRQGVGFVD